MACRRCSTVRSWVLRLRAVGALVGRRSAAQDRLDGFCEGVRVVDAVLGEEGATGRHVPRVKAAGVTVVVLREEDQAHLGIAAVKGVAQVQARGAAAEVDVDDGDVGVEVVHDRARFSGVGGGLDSEPGCLERIGKERAHERLIVDDEQAAHPVSHLPQRTPKPVRGRMSVHGYPCATVVTCLASDVRLPVRSPGGSLPVR